MQKRNTKEDKHITAMADAEFQQLCAKYEEACIARNIKDKDGNRIPTWKDGLARVVPVIFRPYCEWAAMIKNKLEQKGFFAPYNKAVGYEVMTEIAKNFGPSFYKIIPEDAMYNLQKTLKFLSDFDKPASSILQLPPMGAIEIKLSITYRWKKALLKDRNPHQNDEWMASLAWTNVVDKLPATIRCSQAVIDVKKFPTTKQFDQIDRMYEEYVQATGPTEPVNMVSHPYQNYQENFLRGGTVNAMVDPYAIMPDPMMDTQDIAQVNYQQAYNQARWRNSPGPGYHHPYRSNYQPYYGQQMYQQPMQPPPPAPAPATTTENVEKKEEEKKEEKPAEKPERRRGKAERSKSTKQSATTTAI